MRKRLRKKLGIGEFAQSSFDVKISFKDSLNDDQLEEVFDKFIFELIEGNDLLCGGGGDKNGFECCVQMEKCLDVTEEHRILIENWLKNEPLVDNFEVGPIVK
jgi:uncharacterized protein YggL (DUF469 family)